MKRLKKFFIFVIVSSAISVVSVITFNLSTTEKSKDNGSTSNNKNSPVNGETKKII